MAISRRLFVGSGAAAAISYLTGLERATAKPRRRRIQARAGVAQGVGTVGITVARTRYVQPSGWPDASNTGVPAGTSLTPFSGDFTTTSNGQVIEDLDVSGSIIVAHNDCIIRRCKVTSSSFALIYMFGGHSGTLVEDCELAGDFSNDGSQALFWGSNVTARRLNIYGVTDAVQLYENNWEFYDNYMHDYVVGEPAHADGLQTQFEVGNVHIYHNTFDFTVGHAVGGGAATNGGMSAGLQMEDMTGNPSGIPNHDWLIENNLFLVLDSGPAPCAYTIRIPTVDCAPHATLGDQNLRIVNNRMTSGIFGYVASPIGNITEWSGNVDHITGDPVP